jgi:hypothetical protein
MTPYHVKLTKQAIKSGDLDTCLNHNLSSGQRMGKDFTPEKGEFVNIHVDNVETKDGEIALLVTAVEMIKAQTTAKVSVASFFDDEDDAEQAPASTKGKVNAGLAS